MTIQIPRLSVVPSADSHRKLATTVNQVLSTIATIAPQSTAGLGAKLDGVTDDSTTIQSWADSGGWLYASVGDSKANQTTIIRKNVHIEGANYGFDGRQASYSLCPGSRITYAAGVAGLDIQPQWPGLTWTPPDTVPSQEGAMHSVIENLGLIGGGGATATGVHARTVVHLRNIQALTFSGKGFDIAGGAGPGDNGESGNADFSTVEYCHAIQNGGDGFHSRGTDANVLKFDTCNANGNSGWGFFIETEFSALLLNCHANSNTLGSYKIINSGLAVHTLVGCYDEGGAGSNCDISGPTVVVGGLMAATAGGSNNAHSAGPMPTIVDGTGYSTFGTIHINWNNYDTGIPGSVLPTDVGCISGSSAYGLVLQAGFSTNSIGIVSNTGGLIAIIYGADKSIHPQGNINLDDATKGYLIANTQVVGSSHPNHSKAATSSATYVAPSGGTTIDTQARASLAQLAADLADMKAKFQAAVLMT